MEQEIQPQSPQPINPISTPIKKLNNKAIVIVALAIIVIAIGYYGYRTFTTHYLTSPAFKDNKIMNVETKDFGKTWQTTIRNGQQLPQSLDISSWKTYQNAQYGFAVQYPVGWSVYADEAPHPESDRSDPRFLVTASSSIKDSKCYASFIFVDAKNPDKYPYSLNTETDKKQECQVTLDNIISTFKLLNSKQVKNITLYAYEKDGSHIFDGAVIVAIDTSTGKIIAEQIANRDGKVVFSLIPGAYRFQPSPLRENRVVGSLNLFVPPAENKPQTLLLTEIGPSGFGVPANTCEKKEEAINLALEQANYCETESDCKLFQPGGFSCSVYTNQSFEASTLLQRVNEYSKVCPVIAYKCPQLEHSPACIKGKCSTGR